MLKWESFEAYVVIGGVVAQEYDVVVETDSTGIPIVSCWIPSQSGKAIQVHAL
jgi:hypothetical protein